MSLQQIELNPWHKRQAALIHHFTSLEYLKSILSRADHLIAMADAMLEERSHLDAMGIAHANWDQTSTAIHFSVHAYPALIAFREGIIRKLAMRDIEQYSSAGENQCSRMLQEYASSMIWATDEQEERFKEEAEAVFRYAGGLSEFAQRISPASDCLYWILWNEGHVDKCRIPRFRVRADITARSGHIPPRTGIYVPKDDAYGSLQFAWTGGYGELGAMCSLNEFGRKVLQRVGRKGLWDNAQELYRILDENRHLSEWGWSFITPDRFELAPMELAGEMFEARPCEWYFVEVVEGEFEEIDGTYAGTGSHNERPHRVAAGKPVTETGWWYSPAQGARRYFKQGDTFPVVENSDWGDTFWLWALDQSAPSLD